MRHDERTRLIFYSCRGEVLYVDLVWKDLSRICRVVVTSQIKNSLVEFS